jgi:methionyl-tRNA formyltransferase
MRLVMMGTGMFAEPAFAALLQSPHEVVGLVTQPDRTIGAERGSTRQVGKGLKSIALEQGIPIFQPESINTPESIASLQAWKPDLLVVAAYGQILARDVLVAIPRGGVNIHASLLPKYRGAAPVAWAIYHGEKETGVTIIRMSAALDAGEMLAQEALAIGVDETAGELEARLADLGSKLVRMVLDQLAAGSVVGILQDKSQATKAPKLTKEHGQIDWSRPAPAVWQQIKAMQPWPTAYTYWRREGQEPIRLIIFRARALAESTSTNPGSLLIDDQAPKLLRVAAGQGTVLEITELQPAGKKRMSAADYLRGHPAHPGDYFGQAN